MANVNINRSVNDPFYRYKMPRILAKVEGKGNGIKTVIANMTEIAKALARPPTYPTKYFGCELGAQTNFDLKNDRYIVNGEHDANKLQEILDGFIKKFVLCPNCDNPETTFTVKAKTIHSKCKACGHAFLIDPKHKLSTFILKNPPPPETNEIEVKEKKENGSPVQENGFDFVAEIITNGNSKHFDDDDDDDWAPEPIESDTQKLSSGIGKLVLDRDLEKSEGERLDMLYQYFVKAKDDGSIEDSKKMLNEAERLELKEKAPLLLCQVVFDTDVLKQIKQHRTLLLRFCINDQKAQKYLLGGIEQLINKYKDVLLPKSALILKKLYDEDICMEDAILAWGAKPSKKFVEKEMSKKILDNCQPVLKWLEDAEEESESDEDDEAVKFDDRARHIGTVVEKPHTNGVEKKQETTKIIEDNGEEIDIDDI